MAKVGTWPAAGTAFYNWNTFLCFEALYRGAGVVVVFPLLARLVGLLPGLVGEGAVGWSGPFQLVLHPPALLLSILVLLLAGLYLYGETAALLLYCERGWRRERITVWALCQGAAARTGELFYKGRAAGLLLMPGLAPSLVPLVGGYLPAERTLWALWAFFSARPLRAALLLGAALPLNGALLVWIFCRARPSSSGVAAWGGRAERARPCRRKKCALAWQLLGCAVLLGAALTALTAAAVLLLALGVRLFSPPQAAGGQFQLFFLAFRRGWALMAGAAALGFWWAAVTALYHLDREEPPLQRPGRRRVDRPAALQAAAAGALVLLVALCAPPHPGVRHIPQIVAHRAGAALGPENTVAALVLASRTGAQLAEIDVQQLGDGTLVVLHDKNLRRTTGVELNVWDADYDAVRKLDAGALYARRFSGEQVPTLRQVLCAARGRIPLMIELKRSGHDHDLARQAVALIRQCGMQEQCMVASAHLELLIQIKRLEPQLPTVLICAAPPAGLQGLEAVDALSVGRSALTPLLVARAHMWGKPVYGWTANSGWEVVKILCCGADGVVTDNPPLAQACIRRLDGTQRLERLIGLLFPGETG